MHRSVEQPQCGAGRHSIHLNPSPLQRASLVWKVPKERPVRSERRDLLASLALRVCAASLVQL